MTIFFYKNHKALIYSKLRFQEIKKNSTSSLYSDEIFQLNSSSNQSKIFAGGGGISSPIPRNFQRLKKLEQMWHLSSTLSDFEIVNVEALSTTLLSSKFFAEIRNKYFRRNLILSMNLIVF